MIDRILRCMQAAFDVEPTQLSESISREDIEQWDSIGTVRLVLCLEEEYSVSIPPESARRMSSVASIADELRALGATL